MKNTFSKIIAMTLALLACISTFTACKGNDKGPKLTDEFIKSELADSDGELDGTLSIEAGTAENVTAFNYIVTNVSASSLKSKSYLKTLVTKMLTNPDKLTYGEFKACKAFNDTMKVTGIFYETENADADSYVDEILSIICDGSAKTYGNWTISTIIDQTADTITIKAIRN